MKRITRQRAPFINAMIYAPPGEGKTTLAATAAAHPDLREVLFADREGGMLSLHEGIGDAITPDQMPMREPVNSTNDLERIRQGICEQIEPYDTIRTVVLDSVTEMQQLNVQQQVAHKKKIDSRRKEQDVDDPWVDDWGVANRRLARVVRELRDAPVNLIVIAHAAELFPKQDERQGKVPDSMRAPLEVQPMLSKALRNTVCGLLDFVWFLRSDDDGVRWLLTQPRGPYYAKTRGPAFAKRLGLTVRWESLEDPLFARIYRCLQDPSYSLATADMPRLREEIPDADEAVEGAATAAAE